MLNNNFLTLGLTLLIALSWLRINDFFTHKGWVSSQIRRKIIHISTGPKFVLCWLLFTKSYLSPYFAAMILLGITLQFALVGSSIIYNPSAVEAMSRTGDRNEKLRAHYFMGLFL